MKFPQDELVELASYSGNGEAEQDDIAGAQAAASENAEAGKTEEKPENDTVPDNTGDVYSEDGERFTEIEEDPGLLLEVAQDNAVKRIQKRIDALQ